MAHKVDVHPLARNDLFDLYAYIEERAGSRRAADFLRRIEVLCDHLQMFPARGTPRDDFGAGIRTISIERRVLVVYRAAEGIVTILRVVYAGRTFSAEDLPS